MARKPTGGPRGRKSTMMAEQIAFMGTYSEWFQAGSGIIALYSKVTKASIEKFGYDDVPEHGTNAIDIANLRMGEDMETLTLDERTKAMETRATARNAIRLVRTSYHHSLDHQSDRVFRKLVVGFGTTTVTEKQTSQTSRPCWRHF